MTTLVHPAPATVERLGSPLGQVSPLGHTSPLPVSSPLFTRQEVAYHCDFTSCWFVLHSKVYDVTDFLMEHPGGEEIMMEYAGGDATGAFWDKGHSAHAIAMLDKYYIGDLKSEVKAEG